MTFLFSTLALFVAPLVYGALDRHRATRDALEGFVLLTVAGIVALHIVPGAWRLAGPASLVLLAVGGLFPLVLERIYRRVLERAHLVVVVLALNLARLGATPLHAWPPWLLRRLSPSCTRPLAASCGSGA